MDATAIAVTLEILVELPYVLANAAITDFALLLRLAAALEVKWAQIAQQIAAVEVMVLVTLMVLAFAILDLSSIPLLKSANSNVLNNLVLIVTLQIYSAAVTVLKAPAIMVLALVGQVIVELTVIHR